MPRNYGCHLACDGWLLRRAVKKILFAGDSTMVGSVFKNGVYSTSQNNIPAQVQNILGASVSCTNAGVGGSTAPEWLFGWGQVAKTWEVRMAESDADIVCINVGINDVFVPWMNHEAYRWCHGEFARIAQLYGRQMVFITPNPIDSPHLDPLWQYQHTVKGLAAELGIRHINVWDSLVYAFPHWKTMLPDAIHPGDDLYGFMGHVVALGLKPLVV